MHPMNAATSTPALPFSANPSPEGNRALGSAMPLWRSVLNMLWHRLRTRTATPATQLPVYELPVYVQREMDAMGYSTPGAHLSRSRAQFEHTQAIARYKYF